MESVTRINPFGVEINNKIDFDLPLVEGVQAPTVIVPELKASDFDLIEQIKEYCRNDFFAFIDLILNSVCTGGEFSLSGAEHFKQMYRLIKAEPVFTLSSFGTYSLATNNPAHNRKLGLLPRAHGKSRVGTIALAMWELFKNPDLRILLISEIWDNARDMLRMIRHIYEEIRQTKDGEHGYVYWVMGDWVSNIWNEDRIFVKPRRKKGTDPSIATAGIEREITSKHFDIIFCDDLIGMSNSQTPDQLKKAIDHYNALTEVGDTHTIFYVWGTTWDYADLYSYILNKLSDRYDILKLRCWDDISCTNPTRALFPEKWSLDKLKEIYQEKMRTNPMQWYCQWLNEPVPKHNAIFNPDNIQWYDYSEIEKKHLTVVIAMDPAGTDNTWSDYTAIVVVGVDNHGRRYVLDYKKFKERDPSLSATFLINTARKYYNNPVHQLSMVGIEKGALELALRPHLEKFAPWLPVIPLPNYNKEKTIRIIECLQMYVATKRIYLQRWMSDLYDQMVRFPKANIERDLLDALAYHTYMVGNWQPTEEDIDYESPEQHFWNWVKRKDKEE